MFNAHLNFCAKCAGARAFSRHIFPAHFSSFCGFFSHIYCRFFYFLCSFTELKAEIVCAIAQAAFLRSSGYSVKENAKS